MVQQRSQKTRERVLETATELIVDRGHEAVSLKDICEKSGVSNGSVFHHFGSKEGIVRELFAEERKRYLGSVARAIIEYDGDPCDAFGEGARAAMQYHIDYPHRFDRLVAEFSDSEWLRRNADVWLSVAADIEQPVIDWAAPHFASGALPLMPPAMFQAMSLGAAELLTRADRQNRLGVDIATQIDTIVTFVTSGLRHIRDLQRAAQSE